MTTTITRVGCIYDCVPGIWSVEVFYEGGSTFMHFFSKIEAMQVHVGQEVMLPSQHELKSEDKP